MIEEIICACGEAYFDPACFVNHYQKCGKAGFSRAGMERGELQEKITDDFKAAWRNGLPLESMEAKWAFVGWQSAICSFDTVGLICEDGNGACVELYDDYSFKIGQPVYTSRAGVVTE